MESPPNYESSVKPSRPVTESEAKEPKFPAPQTQQNVGHAEEAEENRFGELGRADTFEEDRDLGHLGPIVREVGDKLKEMKNKLKGMDGSDKNSK